MGTTEHTENATVFIYHIDSNKTIAKAPILNYDRAHHIITISGQYLALNETPNVSLLILDNGRIMECQGVVRRQDSNGNRDIAYFHAKEKEDRGANRYEVQTKAVIEKIIIAGSAVPIGNPIEVMVENISSSGVFISTYSSALNVDSSFQLKLNIAGNNTLINTTVVRVISTHDKIRKLGCKFVSINS